jgi:Protein of unknown function (DUF1566)
MVHILSSNTKFKKEYMRFNILVFVVSVLFSSMVCAQSANLESNPEVWLDESTGLMWARCPAGATFNRKSRTLIGMCRNESGGLLRLNFRDAVKYIKNSHFAGYSDWRMPSNREYVTLNRLMSEVEVDIKGAGKRRQYVCIREVFFFANWSTTRLEGRFNEGRRLQMGQDYNASWSEKTQQDLCHNKLDKLSGSNPPEEFEGFITMVRGGSPDSEWLSIIGERGE